LKNTPRGNARVYYRLAVTVKYSVKTAVTRPGSRKPAFAYSSAKKVKYSLYSQWNQIVVRVIKRDYYVSQVLADTITRVQKASGRIPTFWDGTATDEGCSVKLYDWLNCMESSAQALLEVAEIQE